MEVNVPHQSELWSFGLRRRRWTRLVTEGASDPQVLDIDLLPN